MQCRPGWFGTEESLTGLRSCEQCAPNTLQPLPGQTMCVPCPRQGVNCLVQDRLEVLPGWFLDADAALLPGQQHSSGGGGLGATTTYTIELTVAGDIDGFNATSFDASLRNFLQCRAPACDVALTLEAASVRVLAAVNDTAARRRGWRT